MKYSHTVSYTHLWINNSNKEENCIERLIENVNAENLQNLQNAVNTNITQNTTNTCRCRRR